VKFGIVGEENGGFMIDHGFPVITLVGFSYEGLMDLTDGLSRPESYQEVLDLLVKGVRFPEAGCQNEREGSKVEEFGCELVAHRQLSRGFMRETNIGDIDYDAGEAGILGPPFEMFHELGGTEKGM
jgi:hypothetical protein